MPIHYENQELLQQDNFTDFARWHHEGIGELAIAPPQGDETHGMRLHCHGSVQGSRGCMAFFRSTLPDAVAIEYTLTVRSRGGLVINYIAIRGMHGEDLIDDIDRLPPRTGIMADYWSAKWGLQSYHVSVSRFNDKGIHTGTSNWRRNPGSRLVGHGNDPINELNVPFRVRITKDAGHLQMFVNGVFAHGVVDHDRSRPIPDDGKFGFRLIGSDVMADVHDFRVYRIKPDPSPWKVQEKPGDPPPPRAHQ